MERAQSWLSGSPRADRQEASLWVSLDEGDHDPVRFWDYFIAALRTIKSSAGEAALALLHSPQPYPIESVLTALINDLASVPSNLVAVLDDYQLIKAETVHAGVAFLLDHLPPTVHIVIATRADPHLPLAHLRGRGQMVEIGADDLRFTVEETAQLFKETQVPSLSDQDITALNAHTEGWPVGLKMAGLLAHGREDARDFLTTFAGSQRYVMDYLIEEVLIQQSQEVRDFLLQTSTLERLTGPLCDYVTGRSGGERTLTKQESSFGGFLVPLDGSRQWYRYHHLFAELLRHQLALAFGAEVVCQLHQRACQWYEDNKLPADAIHHALAAKDWERTMGLIGKAADSLTARGEWRTLLDWFEMVPEKTLRSRPKVYSQYANALSLYGQVGTAENVLDYLESTCRGDTSLQGELAFFRTILAYREGDVGRIKESAKKALELLPSHDSVMRAKVSLYLGMEQLWGTHLQEARSLLTDAFKMGRQAADYWTSAAAAGYLAWILWLQGRLSEALNAAQHSVDQAGQSPGSASPR